MSNQTNLNQMCPSAAFAQLGTKMDALITLVNELRQDFLDHTHRADGAQAGQYTTSTPTTDAPTIVGGTAMTVTAPSVPTLN